LNAAASALYLIHHNKQQLTEMQKGKERRCNGEMK
jgi:hypothetical protein